MPAPDRAFQRARPKAPFIARAASAAVGAVLGIVVGVAFELFRMYLTNATEIRLTSIAVFGVIGAFVAVFALPAVLSGVAACVSFFVGVTSALTPESWIVRGQSPVDWPRWVRWSFALGVLLVVAVVLLS